MTNAPSFTFTLTVKVAALAVGVPEISPVDDLILKPAGTPVALHVYGDSPLSIELIALGGALGGTREGGCWSRSTTSPGSCDSECEEAARRVGAQPQAPSPDHAALTWLPDQVASSSIEALLPKNRPAAVGSWRNSANSQAVV